jgi:hypothetical protein
VLFYTNVLVSVDFCLNDKNFFSSFLRLSSIFFAKNNIYTFNHLMHIQQIISLHYYDKKKISNSFVFSCLHLFFYYLITVTMGPIVMSYDKTTFFVVCVRADVCVECLFIFLTFVFLLSRRKKTKRILHFFI